MKHASLQASAIIAKLRNGKVKNRYAAKNKVKNIKKAQAKFDWLAQ